MVSLNGYPNRDNNNLTQEDVVEQEEEMQEAMVMCTKTLAILNMAKAVGVLILSLAGFIAAWRF